MRRSRWFLAVGALIAHAAAVIGCSYYEPPTFSIHTTGDTVLLLGGRMTVIVPDSGVSEDGDLEVRELPADSVPSSPLLVNNSTYSLTVSPTSLRVLKPILVRFNYASLALPDGVRGPELRLNKVVNGAWQPIPGGTNDSASSTVAAAITSFSFFGALGLPVDTLVVSPPSISVAVGATQSITVAQKDSLGNTLPNRAVSYASSDTAKAKVSGSGVVTGIAAGTATITVASESKSTQVPTTVTAVAVSTTLSVLSVSVGTVASGDAVTLRLQAKDANGNNLTTGGLTVAFTGSGGTSTGTIGATTDSANGRYTATFTAITAGTARTIGATIGGVAVTSTLPTITVTPGAVSTSQSVVSVSVGTVASGDAVTLRLQAKDANGNNLTTGGLIVAFTASGGTSTGTIGATTDSANGRYVATFTAGTAGTARTIGATIGGTAVTSPSPSVTVTPGAVSTSQSTVSVSAGTVALGGAVTLRLQVKDANGNNLTTGGLTVAFTASGGTSKGTIGATTDSANGRYTATFTADTAGTATIIGATIGGAAVTGSLPTVTVMATVPTPWLVFDPSTFANDAAMKAWASWTAYDDTYWMDQRNPAITAGFLDMTTGYDGRTKSLRVDFQDQTASGSRCTDYTPAMPNIALPSSRTELWVEVVAKFSAGFTASAPGGWSCGSSSSYKFFLGRTTPTSQFMHSLHGTGGSTSLNHPSATGTTEENSGAAPGVFDGNWHVHRFHFKLGTSGVASWTMDGITVGSYTGNMSSATAINGLGLGRNTNQGPATLQSVWWGRVTVYNSDPGW